MSGVRTSWQRYTRGCHTCTLICYNFLEATDGSPKAHFDIQAWSLGSNNLYPSVSPIKWLQLNTLHVCIQLLYDFSGQTCSLTSPPLLFWIGYQMGSTDSACNDLGSQLDIPGKGEPQLQNWEDPIELWPFLWGIFLIANWYKRAKPSVPLGWWVWAAEGG